MWHDAKKKYAKMPKIKQIKDMYKKHSKTVGNKKKNTYKFWGKWGNVSLKEALTWLSPFPPELCFFVFLVISNVF